MKCNISYSFHIGKEWIPSFFTPIKKRAIANKCKILFKGLKAWPYDYVTQRVKAVVPKLHNVQWNTREFIIVSMRHGHTKLPVCGLGFCPRRRVLCANARRHIAACSLPFGGGRIRIGRREKWPKKVGRRGKMWGKRVGRREKLAQKVGRREFYSPVPPPSFWQWMVWW